MIIQKSSRSTKTGLCASLCLLIASLTMGGCTTSRMPYAPPMLPADIAKACPAVPAFDSADWDALALAYIDLTAEYARCSARHDAAVRAYDSLR